MDASIKMKRDCNPKSIGYLLNIKFLSLNYLQKLLKSLYNIIILNNQTIKLYCF